MESTSIQPAVVILIIVGGTLFFPLMWSFTLFLLSLGGWRSLATRFREPRPVSGKDLGYRSFRIGRTNYNAVVNVTVTRDGLYFKPMFLFRVFHPPILVPWREIKSINTKNFVLLKYQSLGIGNPRIAEISIPVRWYDEIVDYIPTELFQK